MNQKPTGSPIIAREFFPFVKYFLLIIFILAVIVLVWYIFLKFSKYKETGNVSYLDKAKNYANIYIAKDTCTEEVISKINDTLKEISKKEKNKINFDV